MGILQIAPFTFDYLESLGVRYKVLSDYFLVHIVLVKGAK